jgi:hypothetical protein
MFTTETEQALNGYDWHRAFVISGAQGGDAEIAHEGHRYLEFSEETRFDIEPCGE